MCDCEKSKDAAGGGESAGRSVAAATGRDDGFMISMERASASYKAHAGHFMKADPDWKRAQIGHLQVSESLFERLRWLAICGNDRTIRLDRVRRVAPPIPDFDSHLVDVEVSSLAQLKALAGVPMPGRPARSADGSATGKSSSAGRGSCGCRSAVTSRPVALHAVPTERFQYEKLREDQREAVNNLAFNLLYGEVDDGVVARGPYAAVAEWVLERVKRLPVFVGTDLLVCPDEHVVFSGFATVTFDNVVVVGNGRITLGPSTKLFAYQIKRV
mgnify:CR=1 FL=1